MKYFVLKFVLRNLKTGKIKIAKWSAQRYGNGKERTNCLQAHNCAPLFTCGRRPQTWNEYECSHAVLQIMKYHNNAISRLLQQSAALTSMGLQIFFKDVYMYIHIYIYAEEGMRIHSMLVGYCKIRVTFSPQKKKNNNVLLCVKLQWKWICVCLKRNEN